MYYVHDEVRISRSAGGKLHYTRIAVPCTTFNTLDSLELRLLTLHRIESKATKTSCVVCLQANVVASEGSLVQENFASGRLIKPDKEELFDGLDV